MATQSKLARLHAVPCHAVASAPAPVRAKHTVQLVLPAWEQAKARVPAGPCGASVLEFFGCVASVSLGPLQRGHGRMCCAGLDARHPCGRTSTADSHASFDYPSRERSSSGTDAYGRAFTADVICRSGSGERSVSRVDSSASYRSWSGESARALSPYALGDRHASEHAPWQAYAGRSSSAEYDHRGNPVWPAPPARYDNDALCTPARAYELAAHRIAADAYRYRECEWRARFGSDLPKRSAGGSDGSRDVYRADYDRGGCNLREDIRRHENAPRMHQFDEAAQPHFRHGSWSRPSASRERTADEHSQLDHRMHTGCQPPAASQPPAQLLTPHGASDTDVPSTAHAWQGAGTSVSRSSSASTMANRTDGADRRRDGARESARPSPMHAVGARPCKFGARCMSAHSLWRCPTIPIPIRCE